MVTRRVTINSDTGKVIQDLKIDHSIKRNKALHEQLPGKTSNTTTVLYHKDPAVANQVGSDGEIEFYAADSGASDHFIINRTLMYNKQKPERAVTVTIDGNKTKIDESGDIDLECNDGVQINTRVNNVSIFKNNLISIGRCILDGLKIWHEGLDTMIKYEERRQKF